MYLVGVAGQALQVLQEVLRAQVGRVLARLMLLVHLRIKTLQTILLEKMHLEKSLNQYNFSTILSY